MALLKQSCDVCSLTFRNEEELVEHMCALPHQIRHSRSEPSSKRRCIVCRVDYESLTEYSRHLDGRAHSANMDKFRGDRVKDGPMVSGNVRWEERRTAVPLLSGHHAHRPPWFPPGLPRTGAGYMFSFHPPPQRRRRVLLQCPSASIEPVVPFDCRNLGQSERRQPVTSFTRKKQREEYRRGRRNKNPPTTVSGAETDRSAERPQPEPEQERRLEADSTTSAEHCSSTKRRCTRSNLTTAAMLKRRLLISKAQRVSDRLLADRLNRYKVVDEATTTNSPSTSRTDSVAKIDAGVRDRAKKLFLARVTPALPSVGGEPGPADALTGDAVESKTEDGGGSGSNRETEAADGDKAAAPALLELWRICKEEEEIRVEQDRVKEEMERLKAELQRVWYRQKELQQRAEECAKKKQGLLTNQQ